MSTFTLKGIEYDLGRIDAITQFHLQRRIMPIMAALGISITEMIKRHEGREDAADAEMLEMMSPAMQVISKMTDEEVNYVLHNSLAAVSRIDGGKRQKIFVAGRFMYQDIEMRDMIQLTVAVLKENLGDFFSPPLDGIL